LNAVNDELLKKYGLDFPTASDERRTRLAEDVRVPRISKRKSAISDPERLADIVAEVIREHVAKELAPVRAEIAELRAAQRSFKYCGTYEVGREYSAGDFVTDKGAVWHCKSPTSSRPPSECWQLSVRREAPR
jgi:hypothetical protein